ncbi:angiopoietin-related protein 1-like [Anopheles aquasalis]|uniref:angiopoietin-related protein 1-like n=1 Tax=Anopheles aquasalis TaxID=42839 RepID=UPI00215A4620|nr:angiopoietin-related protein 1-like [Anopheles aquasalis]
MLMNKLDSMQSDILFELKALQESQNVIRREQELFRSTVLTKLENIGLAKNETNPVPIVTSFRSCKEVPASGKYFIQPTAESDRFLAYCEQDFLDGGWLVMQSRFDGTVDFLRNWTEYRNGFGDIEGEHWLGLEHLHQFTAAQPCELIVVLRENAANYLYARYNAFNIAAETEQYRLESLGTYSGTAGDWLNSHSYMMFSTIDRDNDRRQASSCAIDNKGGWWYHNCRHSNLNGIMIADGSSIPTIGWGNINLTNGKYSTKMMLRPL